MIVDEVVRFDRMPPEHERLIWCEWLERHGVDPANVAVPGFICRDVAKYRVVWNAYDRDDKGNIRVTDDRRAALRISRFVQLEGPPLPFPKVEHGILSATLDMTAGGS